jgi:ketosteroid isomerase-like protein
MTEPSTVEQAEAEWLEAMTAPAGDAMSRLMHPDCVVVHAAVGRIDGKETFLQRAFPMGPITRIEAYNLTVRRFEGVAIVSCVQEMHVSHVPDLPPFAIQAAVTRVWVTNGIGWRLAHMQLSRRQPPG